MDSVARPSSKAVSEANGGYGLMLMGGIGVDAFNTTLLDYVSDVEPHSEGRAAEKGGGSVTVLANVWFPGV